MESMTRGRALDHGFTTSHCAPLIAALLHFVHFFVLNFPSSQHFLCVPQPVEGFFSFPGERKDKRWSESKEISRTTTFCCCFEPNLMPSEQLRLPERKEEISGERVISIKFNNLQLDPLALSEAL